MRVKSDAGGRGRRPVVVIGGSVAGLATTLALSQDGNRVTVIERDATPDPRQPRRGH
jgi:2-polyprenyl-6-methoxyphenol hydroxylase-like FAD-dependent oxidoreductase